jgi:peptidoglycan hydrolase CwlO-like protein
MSELTDKISDLQDKVYDLEKENSDLEDDLYSKDKEIESLQRKVSELEDELSYCQDLEKHNEHINSEEYFFERLEHLQKNGSLWFRSELKKKLKTFMPERQLVTI